MLRALRSSAFAFAVLAAAATMPSPAPAATLHPFTALDWQALRSASPHAIAPDGRTLLIEVTHGQATGPDVDEWSTLDDVSGVRTKVALPKHFAPYGFTTSARELYGAYTVDDRAQLALWTIGSAAPRVIARVPGGISAAVPSPDGTRYALLGDPQPPDPLDKVRTVVENDRSALFVVASAGGTPMRWCPDLTFVGGLAWSADGGRIAVVSQTPKIGYHRETSRIDMCGAHAAHIVTKIATAALNEIPYPGAGIAWANGGRDLAFLSTTTDVITPDHLWTVPAAGGTPVDRTPDIPYSILALRGDAHGDVWLTLAHGVRQDVGRYANGHVVTAFAKPGGVIGMPATTERASAPPALAFALSDPAHASDVAVLRGRTLVHVTNESDALLANVALGRVIRHRWTAADGTPLEAIVTFPANWNGRPGKFLVLPHGGPEANDELRLDALARMIAGRGYVVMQPEYRGSTGYGSAHLQAIYQHFGDTAYRDVDAATTEAIARGWANPKRLAIFGWSAGGFMTSWTVTQTSRYRAAIEGAGITEWLSFIMSSDVQQTDFDARKLEGDAKPFLQYSAVMYADKITTPLLILHGAADERVPTYQGRELFVIMKERGKTVRMVTYPGSPHFPRLWEQRRNVAFELLRGLDTYDP
jgi:dipeptidyl aminopeptidase/acylaminoacyl peptidase